MTKTLNPKLSRLSVLNSGGDLRLEWDPTDPESVAKAREEVQALAAAGYQFFLVDGNPADAVAAGNGALSCRRVTADELTPAPPSAAPGPAATASADTRTEASATPARRGPGRPRKSESAPAAGEQPAQDAVAVRPLRGG